MNIIAISKGNFIVYWNSIIIALGAITGLMLALALCHDKKCSKAAVLTFFPFAFGFSVVISRLMSWYFFAEQYPSFNAAMTDFTSGSFCVTGVIFGCMLAALIVRGLKLAEYRRVLDVTSPGVVLAIAFVRLSAVFGNTCRSKIIIDTPFFRRLPFAVGKLDAAGNTVYRFATFFVAFLLFALVSLLSVEFFVKNSDKKLVRGAGDIGNTANMALIMACAVELLMDSTRSDSTALHFMLITGINKYVNFISVSMIIGAFCILFVFIHYLKHAHRACGKAAHMPLLIAGFVLGVAGVGGTEYCAQRFTRLHTLWHLSQAVFTLLMIVMVYRAYLHCLEKEEPSQLHE